MPLLNGLAPELEVEAWVQGQNLTIKGARGKVLVIEVFQVNCPGCFISGIPEAIEVHQNFKNDPVEVCGLATAFEDFDKNTLNNLVKLLETGEVIGDALQGLTMKNLLDGNRLRYDIPFPVAWDKVVANTHGCSSEEEINKIIRRDIHDYDHLPLDSQQMIRSQVVNYLQQKRYKPLTFDKYELRGTPSALIIDKKGILRHSLFGSGLGLNDLIETLLREQN
jgi:hypothetical protein